MACETFSNKVHPGEVFRLIFAGYVRLASQSPYPIKFYSVANNIIDPTYLHVPYQSLK